MRQFRHAVVWAAAKLCDVSRWVERWLSFLHRKHGYRILHDDEKEFTVSADLSIGMLRSTPFSMVMKVTPTRRERLRSWVNRMRKRWSKWECGV
jgi:hypothetical protein